MGDPHNFTVQRIIDIDTGIAIIMSKDINSKLSFRLGRLKARTESVVKLYNQNRDNLIKKYGKMVDGNLQIAANTPEFEKYAKGNEELLNQEDEIKVPELLLGEFTNIDNGQEIEVSPKFFALMGDIIKSDIDSETYEGVVNREIAEFELAVSFVEKNEFPASLSYKVGMIKFQARSFSTAMNEKRKEMLKEVGVKQPNGEYIIDAKDFETQESFNENWTSELNKKPSEKFEAPKLYLDEFVRVVEGKTKEINMPPKFFTLLGDYIEEERPKLKVSKKKKKA